MLMKEFERTEDELENKVAEAQKRYDAEQMKVNKLFSIKKNRLFFFAFRLANIKEKSIRKRKISKV